MDIDDFILQNLTELSNKEEREKEEREKEEREKEEREKEEREKEERENSYNQKIINFSNKSSINEMVQNLNDINKVNNPYKKQFFHSIFRNKINNNIQIEYLKEFDLSNISRSLDDLFTKDAIIVNQSFCKELFHVNLMKYITQYMSYLVFDNPHYHLVFKNMPFMKTQLYGMKQNIKEQLISRSVKSGQIVNVLLNLNLNVKNIGKLTNEEIIRFKSKKVQPFEITFLVK